MGEIKILEDHKEPMFKDGDGGGGSPFFSTIIEKVDNGYIIVWIDAEGIELREVYNNREELLNQLNIFL